MIKAAVFLVLPAALAGLPVPDAAHRSLRSRTSGSQQDQQQQQLPTLPVCFSDDDCLGSRECFDFMCFEPTDRQRSGLPSVKPRTARTGRHARFVDPKDFVVVPSGPEDNDRGRGRNSDSSNGAAISVVFGLDEELDTTWDPEVLADQARRLVNPDVAPGYEDGDDGERQRFAPVAFEGEGLEAGAAEGRVVQGQTGNGHGTWQRVTATKNHPWRTIGRLSTGCTATLVGPRTLLTAAHCVFNVEKQEWTNVNKLRFAPGQKNKENWWQDLWGGSNSAKPFGELNVQMITISNNWIQHGITEYDWAIITLPKATGLGWLGFTAASDSTWKNGFTMNLAGYPASKEQQMWYDYCPTKGEYTTSKTFQHHCDTEGGNSGSGVYRKMDGSRYVVGVHCWGSDNVNGGFKIDTPFFNTLLGYKNAYQ